MEPARQRQFKIQYCLGRGGYGEVYRATMSSPGGLRAEVAVKLLRLDLGPHDDAVRRLKDEGRMLGLLQHPSILRVYDLAVLEGRVGLVTEYVDGQDLLALFGRLSPRALLEVIALVAEGLDAAWNHVPSEGQPPLRLVHRDIKPSNIRVGRHGEVKILDFGIARSTSEGVDREARTGTGSTVGSLAYMAPERFTRAPPSPASDVHALGCVLYEGLSGRRLFEDPVPVEMFRLAADPVAYEAHVDAAWKSLPADLDPALSNLLAQMVSHAPGDRPTAIEVRRLGEAVADRLPGLPLRLWAREFAWPKSQAVPGFLDGKTITEGSQSDTQTFVDLPPTGAEDRSSDTFRIEVHPDPDAAPAAALPAATRTSRVGLAVVATLVAALAIGAVSVAFWRSEPRGPVVEAVPVPVPVVVPAPAPVRVVPPPAPAPSEVPAPTEPAPAPVPTPPGPVPVPVPVVTPSPSPSPAPSARGSVVVVDPPSGGVELRRGREVHRVPGAVAAGADYQLWVDFGTGMALMNDYVDVLPDHTTTVRCNRLRQTCDVD